MNQGDMVSELALAQQWKRQGITLSILIFLLIIIYFPTYASMVSLWMTSDTFSHAFAIAPISLWLIWRVKEQLFATMPKFNYLGVPIIIGLGLIWLLAKYVGVVVVEQLAATLMIPVLVFTVLGWQATSVIAFPLLFLLFCVPIGDELTPYLIDFTADFTISLINAVGIPVYREGNYFELPTGSWSVVAACSGVRYLIASLTLGLLFAYLNYQDTKKRLIFVAFSIIVPIFANGVRAFLIVMIGHFSGMELATGVDHLIYGWVFFGLVIGLMFYIGSFWRDDTESEQLPISVNFGNVMQGSVLYRVLPLLMAGLIVAWPLKVTLEGSESSRDIQKLPSLVVEPIAGWMVEPAASTMWSPAYHGFDRVLHSAYSKGEDRINLFIGYYAYQRQGAELGNFNNVLVSEHDERWRQVNSKPLMLPEVNVLAPTALIKGGLDQYFTAYFYYVAGEWVTNKYHSKWIEAKARLLGEDADGALIAITVKSAGDGEDKSEGLKQFLTKIYPNLERSLSNLSVSE